MKLIKLKDEFSMGLVEYKYIHCFFKKYFMVYFIFKLLGSINYEITSKIIKLKLRKKIIYKYKVQNLY